MNDGTSWPDAAIAIAGILMIVTITVVVIIQLFATARARMSVQREAAYRQLVEEAALAQSRTADQLGRATTELIELRQRTAEVERVLKEVE